MEYSMKSYIEDKFSDVIYDRINNFIEAVGDIDLEEIEIQKLYIKDRVNSLDFKILVEAILQ